MLCRATGYGCTWMQLMQGMHVFQKHTDGVENADSFNINAHVWLFANQTCSPLWVKVGYPFSLNV